MQFLRLDEMDDAILAAAEKMHGVQRDRLRYGVSVQQLRGLVSTTRPRACGHHGDPYGVEILVPTEVVEYPVPFPRQMGEPRGRGGTRLHKRGNHWGVDVMSSQREMSAASAVVIGTAATSPMLPTRVRTTSWATSWAVTSVPKVWPDNE